MSPALDRAATIPARWGIGFRPTEQQSSDWWSVFARGTNIWSSWWTCWPPNSFAQPRPDGSDDRTSSTQWRNWGSGAAPVWREATFSPRRINQGRNGSDPKAGGHLRSLVGVDLHQLDLASHVIGQTLERRADRPARAAPGRPDVHEHRKHRGCHDLGEGVVPRLPDPGDRRLALPAPGHAFGLPWDPILDPTRLALHHTVSGLHHVTSPCSERSIMTVKPSSPWSTRTTPPSRESTLNRARATRVSTWCAMNRRRGRAP